MKNSLSFALAAGLTALLFGCATPQSRIDENPELFNTFDAKTQDAIRAGRVELGFSKDAVFMALGRADRSYTRTTDDGQVEVWSYTDAEYHEERQLVQGRFSFRDQRGTLRYANDSVWVNVRNRIEYDRFRVEFKDKQVVAYEESSRSGLQLPRRKPKPESSAAALPDKPTTPGTEAPNPEIFRPVRQ